VLIDRKDSKQAIAQIQKIAQYIQDTKRAVVIFPEGTRSRNGSPKKFQENGLKTLFKYAPDAWIVPVSIQNSWKLVRFGTFPMGLGNRLVFEVHNAYPVNSDSIENLIAKTEQIITQKLIS
jgi:1-acyl-sn-glycerol-3-phosphate acyltransferase